MSATNTTPNLGLPQFTATDKPTWLGDVNGAMSTIDTKVATAESLREETMGIVIYEATGTDNPNNITLSAGASLMDTIQVLGKVDALYNTDLTTPIQVVGEWRNNDGDRTRNIILNFVELDAATPQKREIQDIWTLTNATTLTLSSSTEYQGSITEPEVENSTTTPHITITKIVGYRAL